MKKITLCICDSYMEDALYVDGKLVQTDDTIYAAELLFWGEGEVLLEQRDVDLELQDDDKWPQNLSDLKPVYERARQ